MTLKERKIVKRLNHPVYTADFLERWICRNDNVNINAPAALQAMGAKGFYEAVKQMAKFNEDEFVNTPLWRELFRTVSEWDEALENKAKETQGTLLTVQDRRKCEEWDGISRHCEDKFKVFKLMFEQFYGMKIYFVRDADSYGVCNEDRSVWIVKGWREQDEYG